MGACVSVDAGVRVCTCVCQGLAYVFVCMSVCVYEGEHVSRISGHVCVRIAYACVHVCTHMLWKIGYA